MEIWEEKSTQIINVQLNEFSPTGHTHLNHLPKWVSEHCRQPWSLSHLLCHYPKDNHDFNFYHHRLILPIFELWENGIVQYYPLVSDFVQSMLCSWDLSMLCTVRLHCFSLVYGIALYEYPTISFSVLLLINIWIVSNLRDISNNTAMSIPAHVFWSTWAWLSVE